MKTETSAMPKPCGCDQCGICGEAEANSYAKARNALETLLKVFSETYSLDYDMNQAVTRLIEEFEFERENAA